MTTNNEQQSNDLIDYVEGATVGDMLDFLSKELIRLQCEQTLHLFAYLADRQRSQRQAKEAGNRTKTLERQKIIDRAFEQVDWLSWKTIVSVRLATIRTCSKMFSHECRTEIDTYLEDLILQSISDTADERARDEIQRITKTLADLTDPQ